MRSPVPASLRAAVVALLVLPPAAMAQEAPKNLQVLPEEISRAQLNTVMRGFTVALGVRCSTCHVGEEGQPLSTYDFASDEKPMKVKARAMLRMAGAINNDYLAELPDRRQPNVAVTCVTCHRGVSRPQPIEDIVILTEREEGVEAALQLYRQLRERYYGAFAYDFSDRPLIAAGEALAGISPDAARSILELNLEFHPASAGSFMGLALIADRAGDTERAIELYRKVLEIQPDDQRVQRRLRELGGGGA